MELFLSYSRKDSAMGDRIRTDLEAAGHNVWLDRDDIRGGEQWRTSIAEGIGKADRVVLLISPHSMASDNVGREVSLAEDLEKPIIPLLMEPSDIPAGFQYLLAGIHYIEFEGRPYSTALAELVEDLGRAGAQKPSSTPGVPVTPRGRAWLIYAAVAVVVVASILIFRPDNSADPTTLSVEVPPAASWPNQANWIDTGVPLEAGQVVDIAAEGEATHDGVTETGPAGDPNPDVRPFNLAELPDDNHNALVGRIGPTGAPFLIGEQRTFTADSAGVLYLGVNDQGVQNNTGFYVASITVTPEPDG
jgi:hypothetical protein